MTNLTEQNNDRRQFFRINDTVIVKLTLLSEQDATALGDAIVSVDHSEQGKNKTQLRALQTTFTYLTDQINHTDRDVARALRLLDDKINLITQNIYLSQHQSDMDNAIEANLSGGGIAFLVADKMENKTAVDVKLQLLPSFIEIHAIAKVISCSQQTEKVKADKPLYLRLAFTHMSEQDRSLLVKHTLTRQAAELRAHKQQDDS